MIAELKKPRGKTKRLLKKLVEEIYEHVRYQVVRAHLTPEEQRQYDTSRSYDWETRTRLLHRGQERAQMGDLWTETKGQMDQVLAWIDKWADYDTRVKIHEALAEKGLMEPTPAVLAKREADRAARQVVWLQMIEIARHCSRYDDFGDKLRGLKAKLGDKELPDPSDMDPARYLKGDTNNLVWLWEHESGFRYADQLKIGGAGLKPGIPLEEWEKLTDEDAEPDTVALAEIMYSGPDLYHNSPTSFHDEFGEVFTERFDPRPGANAKDWWGYVSKGKAAAQDFRHWFDTFKRCGFRQLGGLYHDENVAIVAWLAWEGVGLRLRIPRSTRRLEIGITPVPYAVREHHERQTPRLL